jgi:hypothetical protein
MLESDGLCRDYTHDARGRLIQALRTCTGTGLTFTRYDFAYGPDNLRVETVRNGSVASGVTDQLTDGQRTYFLSAFGLDVVEALALHRQWLPQRRNGSGSALVRAVASPRACMSLRGAGRLSRIDFPLENRPQGGARSASLTTFQPLR